jgi:hypothetical protein
MRMLKKASQRSLLPGNALEVNPFMKSEESQRMERLATCMVHMINDTKTKQDTMQHPQSQLPCSRVSLYSQASLSSISSVLHSTHRRNKAIVANLMFRVYVIAITS